MPYQRNYRDEDPEFRRERARKAGLASTSLDAYVRRVLRRAPELTDGQKAKLAAVLREPRTGEHGRETGAA